MATNKRTLSRIGFYCGLALFLIITLFPFFVMLMTSFKGAKEAISLHPTLLPQQWTLEHYVDIFNPMIFPFVDYFRNSLVVSVVSSVVAVFLGILGADPHSCDDGIHAAATGAIWLGAIQGFAGVSVRDGELHLNPALPEQWQQLSFPLFWQGCELQVTLDAQRIAIRTSAPVSLRLNGQLISVAEESVFCLGDFILPFNGTATTHQEDE